jgi:hypothetical protein
MRLAATVMMAAVAAGAWEAEAGGAEARSVTVCMSVEVPAPVFPESYLAQSMASEIFATVGVRLEWHHAGSCPASPDVIKISIAGQAPKGQPKAALAYALPYEGTHIVVFSERVKLLKCACTRQLLAYVLVHEITHILEGVSRHSESGIMKAHWNNGDYYEILRKNLGFAAEDVDLIHLGLDLRAARSAGNAPAR